MYPQEKRGSLAAYQAGAAITTEFVCQTRQLWIRSPGSLAFARFAKAPGERNERIHWALISQ
jgi:hypothetical protein